MRGRDGMVIARFPMLGGWKDEFEFSYALPSKTALKV